MDNEINSYLRGILKKYQARDLSSHSEAITELQKLIQRWANSCFVSIKNSGSRAKGTAVSLASDVDYLISLTSSCNENKGGLKSIYNSLYTILNKNYQNVKKQNVSIRINLNGLEIDITPAKKQVGNTNNHNLYVSKYDTWKQTNIQKHITDVSSSGRTNEIKLLKIWRELNVIDFPSIYLEYLIINNILLKKSISVDSLSANMRHILNEIAKDKDNPLYLKIIDPANSNNILSDLLSSAEKSKVIKVAKASVEKSLDKVFY